MSFFLPEHAGLFPHPFLADEEGFLAIGYNLNPDTLVQAYSNGIFPWYSDGEPILWWYTHPRCVLFPSKIKIQKSMRSYLKNKEWQIAYNQNFEEVINRCQKIKRKDQQGTWITSDMIEAYSVLHKQGIAHSVEVYNENQLIGGLYGLSLGKIFFGESMFSEQPNASKYALIHLAQYLESQAFTLIDCQQETSHLMRMGAEIISKEEFWMYLQKNKLDYLRVEPLLFN